MLNNPICRMPYIERNDGRGPHHAVFVTVLQRSQLSYMQETDQNKQEAFLTRKILLQGRASSCLSRGMTEKTGKQACK